MCYLCEFMIPDILAYHKQFLEESIKYVCVINDYNEKTMEEFHYKVYIKVVDIALCVIELIAENIEADDLKEYSPIIMGNILKILNSDQTSNKIKKDAISCLSAIIKGSEQA